MKIINKLLFNLVYGYNILHNSTYMYIHVYIYVCMYNWNNTF